MRHKISNFDLFRQMLSEVSDDDFTKPWSDYPCLEWPRGITNGGYGMICGRSHVKAHREAYERSISQLPKGYGACHHCDNPPCFRPIHLFAGTHLANMRDMFAKQRRQAARGEQAGKTKLTEDQVKEIRRRFAAGESYTQILQDYPVRRQSLWSIINRETWAHI